MRQKVDNSAQVSLACLCLCWQLPRVHEQLSQLPGLTVPLSGISVGKIGFSDSNIMVRVYAFLNNCSDEALAVCITACGFQFCFGDTCSTWGMSSIG